MKKWALVIMVVFVFSFIVGCSGSQQSSPSVPSVPVKAEKAASPVIDAEMYRRQTEAKNREDDKAAAIQAVKAAFSVSLGDEGPRTNKPEWLKKAKGEKVSPIVIVKAQHPIFQNMEQAFTYFNPKYIHSFGVLKWGEVGLEEKDAKKIYCEAGAILVKNLLATLSFSREVREQAGKFGRGDGVIYFSDGVRMLNYAIEILTAIEVDPKVDIRKIALGVHKEEIALCREELAGRPDSADAQGLFYGAISDAIDGWHFSPQELGLKKDEIALLKKSS